MFIQQVTLCLSLYVLLFFFSAIVLYIVIVCCGVNVEFKGHGLGSHGR